MHSDGALLRADALEEKDRRKTQHAEKRQQAEVIDVRQQHRLASDHSVNDTVSLLTTSAGQYVSQLLKALLDLRVVRIDVVDQRGLVNLTAARQHRRHRRNANAPTRIA